MTFAELMQAKVDEAVREITANQEKIIRAFIAETGCFPSECEMVQETTDTGLRWYVRKRTDI